MSKNIELDKFYTPKQVAKDCIDTFWRTCFGITEIIEPSAGNGAFSLQIPNCIAYDLEPEHESIIRQDFLKLNLPYKQGRLIIGNPPFGDRNNLARSFYKKATELCDAIAFILPISQLDNSDSLYEFDLIKSVDLGVLEYSGMKIHCCFNIYTRPKNGLNSKPNLKIDWIKIYREDQYGYENVDFDFAICRRGNVGTIRTERLQTQTYKIKVTDSAKIEEVKNTILKFDWHNFKKHQSAPSLSKNDIYRLFTN
jgi:hypothetical protein